MPAQDACAGPCRSVDAPARHLNDLRDEWASLLGELGWATAFVNERGGLGSNVRGQSLLARRWRHIGHPLGGLETIASGIDPADILIDSSCLLVWRSAEVAGKSSFKKLTPREEEVLRWLRQGKRSDEIALILGSSKRTVDKHLQNVYRKLGVQSALQAIFHEEP